MTDLTGAVWRKSSRSSNQGNCVEVAALANLAKTAVRDSKNTSGPALVFPAATWATFLAN